MEINLQELIFISACNASKVHNMQPLLSPIRPQQQTSKWVFKKQVFTPVYLQHGSKLFSLHILDRGSNVYLNCNVFIRERPTSSNLTITWNLKRKQSACVWYPIWFSLHPYFTFLKFRQLYCKLYCWSFPFSCVMLKIGQRPDKLTNSHMMSVVCVCCCEFCLFGFPPTNQYCEQMRKFIFINLFPHRLLTTKKNLHKICVNLFVCIEPVARRQRAGHTLLLKSSTMKKDLSGPCSS